MGHPTDPLMRVGTSGTEATGKHYSNDPATAGLVFTSTGPETVPTWAPGAGGDDIIVTRVLFVDAARPAAGANGALNHPFLTVQAAVTQVLTNAWTDAIIMVAPGVYAGAITIGPSAVLTHLVITGWGNVWPLTLPNDLPNLGGLITIASNIEVDFSKVYIGGNITAANPAVDNLVVSFSNCRVASTMTGALNMLSFVQTQFDATVAITGTTNTAIRTDGFSWASLVRSATVITPGTYLRNFYDTGADWSTGTITAAGLAIGASRTVSVPYVGARPNEYAIPCMDLVVAADYTVTFSHTDIDTVYFRVRNDSRASTNFAEPAHLVVFHSDMSQIPSPP